MAKIIYHLMPFFALFGILFALCSFCFSWAQHHIASWLVACYFYFVSIQSELRTCAPLTTPSFVLFPTHCPFPSCRLLMLFVFTFLCAFGVWVYVCVLNSTHTSAFATQFLHSSLPTFYGKHPRLLVYSSKNVFR